jgi:diguanylate cyclase (GGDEF)-like protein
MNPSVALPAAGRKPRAVPDEARLRGWRRQVLAALLSQTGGIGVMALVVLLGHADARLAAIWAPLSVAFSLFVLLALRRGWTWHLDDPTLTAAQIAWSIGSTAVCYALSGPLKLLALPMACLGLVFSIFALPARTVGRLTAYTLLLYAAVMVLMSQLQPERYPAAEQAVILLQLTIALGPLAWLATRMSELRARLGRQKSELERALARIEDMAMRDELTGLFNRRRMVQELARAEADAREGRGCCVALVDLDHFKHINDAHGHAAGDAVLRAFAQTAHAAVLGSDRLGRWGGEEFVVVFATGAADAAAAGARRILETSAARAVPWAGGEPIRFTVSIGLAPHRAGESIEETLERADRALYAAKEQGRNRVVIG